MTKAVWNGVVIAESGKTVMVEGNHYFPPESVKKQLLKKSKTPYTCPWKGECQFYDINVKGKVLKDGGWEYPDPKPTARKIKGYFAFWKGVEIVD